MAESTITTLDKVLPAMIADQIMVTARAARVFRPLITEYEFSGPGKTLDLVALDAPAAAAYTDGAARTFTAGTPTSITFTPEQIDVAMSFTDGARRRSAMDMVSVYAAELGRAVAVKMDSDIAGGYSSATGTTTDTAAVTLDGLMTAIGVVKSAAKDQAGLISAVLHTSQWDNLCTDDDVIAAQVRGGPQGVIGGQLEVAGGAVVRFSTSIYDAASHYQQLIFTKRAFALVWKTDLQVDAWDDRNNKAFRVAAGADYGAGLRFAGECATYPVDS